jgi:hypothetical protein
MLMVILVIEEDENANMLLLEYPHSLILNVTNTSILNSVRVTNNGIFNQRIGIANTQPSGEIHIGDPLVDDVRQTLLITRNGIGIGTDDLDNVDASLYALDGGALFGSVGIGTTTVNDDIVFYVNGNSQFAGIVTATSFIGNGSGLTGISTFSGDYGDLTNTPLNLSDFNDNIGIVTSSDPLEITVESGRLVFNVVGVGSTSFLLS